MVPSRNGPGSMDGDAMGADAMKPITSVNPEGHARPGGHYSHGTVANGFVFVSGQLPIAPNGDKLSQAPFGEQVRQVLANVESVLKACGSSVEWLVQVRVY